MLIKIVIGAALLLVLMIGLYAAFGPRGGGITCERCGEARATFHLTSVEPDRQVSQRHLCMSCAAAEGLIPPRP